MKMITGVNDECVRFIFCCAETEGSSSFKYLNLIHLIENLRLK
jgi:hypothetical protein